MPTLSIRFQVAGHTAAEWTAGNPVLLDREWAIERDTGKVKVGDGATAWTALPYFLVVPTPAEIDERARDALGAALVGGANITITPNDGSDTITVAVSGLAAVATSGSASDLGTGTLAVARGGTGATAVTGSGNNVLSMAPALTGIVTFNDGSNVGMVYTAGDGTLTFRATTAGGLSFSSVSGDFIIKKESGTFLVVGEGSTGRLMPGADNTQDIGAGFQRWATVYAGTGTINTSDAREKRRIGAIPDAWLDAWGDVEWCRFKFADGERWHVGAVAQQVRDAFAARGLDAREIGLLCFDEWEARPVVRAKHDRRGNLVREARPGRRAGNRWGLRYDECQALEAAWQRREIANLRRLVDRLTER